MEHKPIFRSYSELHAYVDIEAHELPYRDGSTTLHEQYQRVKYAAREILMVDDLWNDFAATLAYCHNAVFDNIITLDQIQIEDEAGDAFKELLDVLTYQSGETIEEMMNRQSKPKSMVFHAIRYATLIQLAMYTPAQKRWATANGIDWRQARNQRLKYASYFISNYAHLAEHGELFTKELPDGDHSD